MKLKRATIKDIAKESGYSVMTVSFALRNHEKVKPATRERIHDVAQKLGYRPDPEMVRLMNRVRRNPELETVEPFAIINFNEKKSDFNLDLFSAKVMEGTKLRLEKHGHSLEEYWLGDGNFDKEAVTNDLRERGINVLLLPVVPKDSPLIDLDWSQFTVASIDERPLLPDFHRIHPNHYNNTLLLLRKVTEFGFKRIGLASTTQMLGLDRYAHFGAFYSYFQYMRPDLEYIPPLPEGTEPEKLKDWYHKYKPEVVIVTADWIEGAIRSTLGLSIPDEICVVCSSVDFNFSVAGIDQRPDLIGSAAADLLMAHAYRYEKGVPPYPKTMLIEGSWRQGPTIRDNR